MYFPDSKFKLIGNLSRGAQNKAEHYMTIALALIKLRLLGQSHSTPQKVLDSRAEQPVQFTGKTQNKTKQNRTKQNKEKKTHDGIIKQ